MTSYKKLKLEYEEVKRKLYVVLDSPDSEEALLIKRLREHFKFQMDKIVGEPIRPTDWTVKVNN
jgi:hypothetical protein